MGSRAVLCSELGDPQSWRIVTKEKPNAGAGEVVVKITLNPVNPTDTLSPNLFLSHLGPNRVIAGSEGVGYVEEVGESVTALKKGQRVVPSLRRKFYGEGKGAWQDYVVVGEDQVFVLPDSIPDEIAAQFIINPWTVFLLLSEHNLSKGDYLLQGVAGSVLGRYFMQLACNTAHCDECRKFLSGAVDL